MRTSRTAAERFAYHSCSLLRSGLTWDSGDLLDRRDGLDRQLPEPRGDVLGDRGHDELGCSGLDESLEHLTQRLRADRDVIVESEVPAQAEQRHHLGGERG